MKTFKQCGLFLLAFLLLMPLGQAHERRTVAGKYTFVVGFVNEPAFSGGMNGLDLRVLEGETPLEGLEKTFQATVSRQGVSKNLVLQLRPRHKQPGAYAGYFFPTKPGKYRFHITGTLQGQAIDEIFESGNTFHDIEDSKALKFP